ncbi:MAG TPA: amidohydrolase family protein [Bacteroidota bacterium]|nr:amidohydrolase family protein [Bacteroidota bacterium]
MSDMIIDCHTHINNYHNDEVDSLQQCLDDLLLHMKRNRIDFSLVLTSYKVTGGRPSTRSVVHATQDMKNIFVVAGLSYNNFIPDEMLEIREFIQAGRVRGLKIYPGYEPFYPNDPKLEPAYQLAAETNVPVMIHTGDTYTPTGKLKYAHPLHVDDVAVDHPDVNFVICHLGSPWFRDCMEVVYKNKNVYTDISGLVLGNFSDRFESYMRKQLQEMLIYGVEPDKVLFGTDWPISSMESYVEFIEELSIPEKERKKIMYENAAELFKLPVSESHFKLNSLFS